MQILYLLCLLVLPSLVLSAELKPIYCPDGSSCPTGQTCRPRESTSGFQCSPLTQEELESKKLVVGFQSQIVGNTSTDPLITSDVQQSYCPATLCYGYYCCTPTAGNIKRGVCCSYQSCCPEKTQCCTNSYSQVWCCPKRGRCSSSYMLCYGGASNISPATALVSLLFLLLTSKYFFERRI